MPNYRRRVQEFWNWFDENEAEISDLFDQPQTEEPGELSALLEQGLAQALSSCAFEYGGDHEIRLSVDGVREKSFLTFYLTEAMPEKWAGKWNFFPLKPPTPKGFGLRMQGADLTPDEISVAPRAEEGGLFSLFFYAPSFVEMDERLAYRAFTILLEGTLGEGAALCHVGAMERLDEPEQGMVPLADLADAMADSLAQEDRALGADPRDVYQGYGVDPENNSELRYDVITGFSNQSGLLNGYLSQDDECFYFYAKEGVRPVFLWWEHDGLDLKAALDRRNEIADRIQQEILARFEGGLAIGEATGQAISPTRCYIDFLLYDEEAFREGVYAVIQDYDADFRLSDFRNGAMDQRL